MVLSFYFTGNVRSAEQGCYHISKLTDLWIKGTPSLDPIVKSNCISYLNIETYKGTHEKQDQILKRSILKSYTLTLTVGMDSSLSAQKEIGIIP